MSPSVAGGAIGDLMELGKEQVAVSVVVDRIRKVSLKGTTRKSDKPERFLRIDRFGAQL